MKTIAVQCGHGVSLDGSWDSGCAYKSGGKQYTEAALMLPITKSAVKYLRASGVKVITDADHGNDGPTEWAPPFMLPSIAIIPEPRRVSCRFMFPDPERNWPKP